MSAGNLEKGIMVIISANYKTAENIAIYPYSQVTEFPWFQLWPQNRAGDALTQSSLNNAIVN